jgi:hypothetical protein
MSANRVIPFGYAVENGRHIPHPAESQTVRRIFMGYLGGGSLLTIARSLTADKAEFLPGRSDWNKNRVKRILEDERYTGTGTYPAIIGEDMHRQARTRKDSNNYRQKNSEPLFRPPCLVECALCGAPMKRRHDGRRKASSEVWTCQSPDCHAIIGIEDDALQSYITELLNRLIENPDLIKADIPAKPELPMEVRRLANEIDRELDAFAFDREKLQESIFALAAEKYLHIDSRPYKAAMMRAAFEDSKLSQPEPLSGFNHGLFKASVLKIQLGSGVIRLILKNGQAIERSEPNADSDTDAANDATAAADAAENSAVYPRQA